MPGPLALVEVVGWRSVEGPIRARSGEPQKTPFLLSMIVVLHRDSHIGITKGSSTSSTARGGGGSFKKRKTIGEMGCESRMSKQKH